MNDRSYDYYDSMRGWDQTNPGWHEIELHYQDPRESVIKYEEIIDWIGQNIHGYRKHCRHRYAGNYLRFKFRYERDYLWFKLTWG
jgi:hypothetical protein